MNALPIMFVARNNLHLTKNAIKSALSQDIPVEILLIDNASEDSTVEWVRSKSLHGIFLPRQRSLAECWNYGLKSLWRNGFNQALVCNTDIELRADTGRILSQAPFEFVTSVSVDTWDRVGQAGDRTQRDLYANPRNHPDFSCFLIRKSVTDRIGWFDEELYPAFCEDADYHVRMHRAGIRAVCLDLPYFHVGSATIKLARPGERARIQRGAQANRERFRVKYGCLPGSPEYEQLFA